jgi:hypothetical protein
MYDIKYDSMHISQKPNPHSRCSCSLADADLHPQLHTALMQVMAVMTVTEK